MLDLVIGGSFGDGLKSANSTLTVHLDGHPAPTAERRRISTTSSDTNVSPMWCATALTRDYLMD